jgi:Flp pilus assembly CpaF family ATPase
MAGLVRKKVTVRSKRGKTYQRSVMVRAGAAVNRTIGRVQDAMNRRADAAKHAVVAASPPPPPAKPKKKKRK